MKINKNKISTIERFQKGMRLSLKQYYKQAFSERVKKGLMVKNKKKLSTFD
ncbi:MAG: hypothetical protein WCV71_00920 [Patescibacteria group bacterium]|jgi:hypothetical protein